MCEHTTAWANMMLCDKCIRGWHTFCLIPTIFRNIEVLIYPEFTPADWIREIPQALPIPESTEQVIRSILKKGKQSDGGTLPRAI